MRVKRVLNLALGLFVVAAVALVAWQTMSERAPAAAAPAPVVASAAPQPSLPAQPAASVAPTPVPAEPSTAPPRSPSEPPAVPAPPVVTARPATSKVATPAQKVVAMYFHGNVRCATCRKVEAYAREAVEEGFKEQIAAGAVEFRPVNVDQPENRHFIEDYQLTNKSVVVTEEVDGTVARWVKLDNVWGLVGDHDAYLLYVQDAVRAYVED